MSKSSEHWPPPAPRYQPLPNPVVPDTRMWASTRRARRYHRWDLWVVWCWENPVFWLSLVAGVCVGAAAGLVLS